MRSKIRPFSFVVVVGMLVLTALPAGAHGNAVGQGAVTGEVAIGGNGIPLATAPPAAGCAAGGPTTHTFLSTVIVGVIAHTSGNRFVGGPINVTENGGTACENSDGTFAPGSAVPGSGIGTVNVTSASGTDPLGNTISCSFTGGFKRVGSHVSVRISGSCTLNGVPDHTHAAVEAEFVPTSGDGVNVPITQAAFAGSFTITGTDLPYSIP